MLNEPSVAEPSKSAKSERDESLADSVLTNSRKFEGKSACAGVRFDGGLGECGEGESIPKGEFESVHAIFCKAEFMVLVVLAKSGTGGRERGECDCRAVVEFGAELE